MEDKNTRRQENKTIVMLVGNNTSAYKSNVLSSLLVFLHSCILDVYSCIPKRTNVSYSCIPVFLYSDSCILILVLRSYQRMILFMCRKPACGNFTFNNAKYLLLVCEPSKLFIFFFRCHFPVSTIPILQVHHPLMILKVSQF